MYNSERLGHNPGLDILGGVMEHLSVFSAMLRSRLFERKIELLFEKGLLYGTTHLSIGQEACHVGLIYGLEKKDWIVPTHRCHGYNIARGTKLEAMFAEMLGSRYGVCKGIGGSMHMSDISTYNLGSSAVVGSGIPLAGGVAFALSRQKKPNISVAIFGDGATSRGSLHEMMNIASVWNLPTLFFLENNHYGMSASEKNVISTDEIYKRADGYSIKSEKVDGNDVLAVMTAVERARAYILDEKRPYFIECNTYRQCGHSKSDKRVYRSKREEDEWKKRDPLRVYGSYLIDNHYFDSDTLLELATKINKEVDEAYSRAYSKKDDVLDLNELESLVLAPSPISCSETNNLHRGTYRDAIREALSDILSEDNRATLIGEDIGVYGGCFGVTGNLSSLYPSKVIETPVSEEAFSTLAVGAAMAGEHPIVEVMYGDFSTLASDAIINHASKAYFMSAGQFCCPMIYRTASGGLTGHGAQHTQCLETMFLNVPGLIIVAPSDAYSAKALLKSANRENNPVLFFEHKALYQTIGDIGDRNTFLPIGKGIFSFHGDKLLVIGYSRAIDVARRALVDDPVSFFDLATIKPLDEAGLLEYGSRFDKILIVQDTPEEGSVGESVLRILEKLDGKRQIELLSAMNMPIPFSRTLEMDVLLSEDKIRAKAMELIS